MWLYINDWNYKLNEPKHILTKGVLEYNPQKCNPSIWIDSNINDLVFYIETENNGTQKFRLKDIPIKNWVMITLVLQSTELEIYQNGKLIKTYVLKSIPKLNNQNVYVNQWDGYDGFITKLRYYPTALSPVQIKKLN